MTKRAQSGAPAIPASLRRAGISQVVDNVPPGAYIGGFEAEFVRLFAKTIQAKLFKTGDRHGVEPKQLASTITAACSGGARTDAGRSLRSIPALRDGQRADAVRSSPCGAIDCADA